MTNKTDHSAYYLWFDTEFTSLELEQARILQVAMVVTDARLQRIAPEEQDVSLVVRLDAGTRLSDWVEDHLADLLVRCRSDEALDIGEVDRRLAAYLDDLFGGLPERVSLRPALAGNSLHHDWWLARRYLPSLISRVNYRMLDVSSWKLHWKHVLGQDTFKKEDVNLVRQNLPWPLPESATTRHDAYFDVLASIAEMNHYSQRLQLT